MWHMGFQKIGGRTHSKMVISIIFITHDPHLMAISYPILGETPKITNTQHLCAREGLEIHSGELIRLWKITVLIGSHP